MSISDLCPLSAIIGILGINLIFTFLSSSPEQLGQFQKKLRQISFLLVMATVQVNLST